MAKKHKKSIISFAFVLSLICLILIGKKETNASSTMNDKKVNLQMAYINNHNVFSSNTGIKYIGHRGIGGLAPENTLPSFELAGKLGFWGAECDVRTTIDGNWMILHDDTVNRMTNGTGQLKNLTFTKVRSLDITSGNNINNYKGTKIPRIQDYLLTCKKWGLVPIIEMKSSDNLKYYNKFIETIKKYGNLEKTVVISYSMVSLNELRKQDAYLTLGLICTDINKSNIHYVKTLGNTFIDCSYQNITSSEVTLCHDNNIKVGAWTVDDRVLANSSILKTVDFLTTNELLPEVKKLEVSLNK